MTDDSIKKTRKFFRSTTAALAFAIEIAEKPNAVIIEVKELHSQALAILEQDTPDIEALNELLDKMTAIAEGEKKLRAGGIVANKS